MLFFVPIFCCACWHILQVKFLAPIHQKKADMKNTYAEKWPASETSICMTSYDHSITDMNSIRVLWSTVQKIWNYLPQKPLAAAFRTFTSILKHAWTRQDILNILGQTIPLQRLHFTTCISTAAFCQRSGLKILLVKLPAWIIKHTNKTRDSQTKKKQKNYTVFVPVLMVDNTAVKILASNS